MGRYEALYNAINKISKYILNNQHLLLQPTRRALYIVVIIMTALKITIHRGAVQFNKAERPAKLPVVYFCLTMECLGCFQLRLSFVYPIHLLSECCCAIHALIDGLHREMKCRTF